MTEFFKIISEILVAAASKFLSPVPNIGIGDHTTDLNISLGITRAISPLNTHSLSTKIR